MRRTMWTAALAATAISAAPVAAETVRLRSGDVLEGTYRDQGDRIEVATPAGAVSVRWRDVDVVFKDKTARDLYAERLAATPSTDAAALFALALWAGRAGLAEERSACLAAALAADPDHAGARDALRQQKAGGAWLSGAALLEAKGFVGRDGAWVLKEEAESIARRAEAAKGFLPPEKRADEILRKAAEGGEPARKFALDALAGMPPDDVLRPALRALRRGEPGTREVAARALGRVGDVDAVRPLVTAAILDREASVRTAAVAALKEFDRPDLAMPFARALWSEASEVRMNAAEALGSIGGSLSVEWLIRRVASGGGPGGRNNIFVGTQTSYISDFDVEIAQASQVGDPIVGTIREGVILDARVLNAREEWTEVERRVFYTSLARATGRDLGQDAAAWTKWWQDEGRVAMSSPAK